MTRCASVDDPTPADTGGKGSNTSEIPPISTNESFYVVWFSGPPSAVAAEDWVCAVDHEGVSLGTMDMSGLGGLKARVKEHSLQCVESRPGVPRMNNAEWTGLPLREVLEALGITLPQTEFVAFECADGYDLTLSSGEVDGGPLWLVWKMGGEDLPLTHGAPVRVLTPGRFGWLNPKSIRRIHFTDTFVRPDWVDAVDAGYEKAGIELVGEESEDLQIQALIVEPKNLSLVSDGAEVQVLGKAFGGLDPIEGVEVSTDGGESWAEATLTYAPGANIWTLFRYVYTPTGPGSHTIEVRARSVGGKETNPEATLTRLPYVGGMTIEVNVG